MQNERRRRSGRGERTPVLAWLPHIGTYAAQVLGISAQRYLQDAELLVRGAVACANHLRVLALFTDLFRVPKVAAQLFAYAGQVTALSARIYA